MHIILSENIRAIINLTVCTIHCKTVWILSITNIVLANRKVLPILKGNLKPTSYHEQVICRKHTETTHKSPSLILPLPSPIPDLIQIGIPSLLKPAATLQWLFNWWYMIPTLLSTSIFKNPSFSVNTSMVQHLDRSHRSLPVPLLLLFLPHMSNSGPL